MSWTPEHIDMLKALWADGLSAAEIARRLPFALTRNAVLGKAHRLDLAGRRGSHMVGKSKGGRPRKVGAAPRIRPSRARPRPPEIKVSPEPRPEPAPLPEMLLVDIMDLGRDTCRYPVGHPKEPGFAYCGLPPEDGSPYCPHHNRICWRPASKG